jgi:hypothetical protein
MGSANGETDIGTMLRRNAVALISLTVALSGLGYNTWRNETTEAHRNTRQAAFMMLAQLGELQQLVDQRFYGGRRDDLNRINGWGKVSALRDMSALVSPLAAQRAQVLFGTWEERLPALDQGDAGAERAISGAVRATREQVMAELMALR